MQGMRDVVFLGHFVVSPSARPGHRINTCTTVCIVSHTLQQLHLAVLHGISYTSREERGVL